MAMESQVRLWASSSSSFSREMMFAKYVVWSDMGPSARNMTFCIIQPAIDMILAIWKLPAGQLLVVLDSRVTQFGALFYSHQGNIRHAFIHQCAYLRLPHANAKYIRTQD
jgi:hypothetical protein